MTTGADDFPGLEVSVRVAERGLVADLAVAPGEVLAVLGPNGAGKSTLLEAVAGLIRPDIGCIRWGDRILTDVAAGIAVPPHRREISLLAQDPLLFPHLSAVANVAFGPRSRGMRARAATATARGWLDAVDATELAGRRPGALSGGQAQRVALARALAVEPRVVLLDEPMAALDVTVAPAMRTLLRRVLRERRDTQGLSAILVTHDIVDALTLADRVVVLESGRIIEQGPVATVLARPRSAFAARIAGVNLMIGRAVGDEPRTVVEPGATVGATESGVAVSGTAPGGDAGGAEPGVVVGGAEPGGVASGAEPDEVVIGAEPGVAVGGAEPDEAVSRAVGDEPGTPRTVVGTGAATGAAESGVVVSGPAPGGAVGDAEPGGVACGAEPDEAGSRAEPGAVVSDAEPGEVASGGGAESGGGAGGTVPGAVIGDVVPASVVNDTGLQADSRQLTGAVRCGEDLVHGCRDGDLPSGVRAAAVFSPAAVAVHRDRPTGSPRNVFRVRVTELTDRGGIVRVHSGDRPDGAPGPVADLTPAAVAELGLAPGIEVYFAVKTTEVQVYPC